jgi:hypothetical protein
MKEPEEQLRGIDPIKDQTVQQYFPNNLNRLRSLVKKKK